MTQTAFPPSSHPTGLHFFKRNPHPKKENHGDCGTRAICLTFDLPYNKVWNAATKAIRDSAPRYRYSPYMDWQKSKATANGGISRRALTSTLYNLNIFDWKFTKLNNTMFLKGNFPDNCIAELATHYVAIKNGAILDSWDCRGKRPRKLIGYWSKC